METIKATEYCLITVLLIETWYEYSKPLKIALIPFVIKKTANKKTTESRPPLGFKAMSLIIGKKKSVVWAGSRLSINWNKSSCSIGKYGIRFKRNI